MVDSKEYKTFFKYAEHINNYHIDTKDTYNIHKFRYKTKTTSNLCCDQRIFSQNELMFLKLCKKFYRASLSVENYDNLKIMLTFFNLNDFKELIPDFKIEDKSISCEKVSYLVRNTKQLLRWFPEDVAGVMKDFLKMPSAIKMVYRLESDDFINSLFRINVDFVDNIGIENFLKSTTERIIYFKVNDIELESVRLINILNGIKSHQNRLFISDRQLLKLDKMVNVGDIFDGNIDLLVIVNGLEKENSIEGSEKMKNYIRQILNSKNFNKSISKKVIILLLHIDNSDNGTISQKGNSDNITISQKEIRDNITVSQKENSDNITVSQKENSYNITISQKENSDNITVLQKENSDNITISQKEKSDNIISQENYDNVTISQKENSDNGKISQKENSDNITISQKENSDNITITQENNDNITITKDLSSASFDDLTRESKDLMLDKGIINFQGQDVSMRDILCLPNLSNTNLGIKCFKMLLKRNKIIIGDKLPDLIDLGVTTFQINAELQHENVKRYLLHDNIFDKDVIFVLDGECRDDMSPLSHETLTRYLHIKDEQEKRTLENAINKSVFLTTSDENDTNYYEICRQNCDKIVYKLNVSPRNMVLKRVYDSDFYIKRKFTYEIVVKNDKIEISKKITKINTDFFIVGNISNSKQSINVSERFRNVDKNNLFVTDSDQKAIRIYKEIEESDSMNPIHLLERTDCDINDNYVWKQTRGSLEVLRGCTTLNADLCIDEQSLTTVRNRVLIVADEPGTGKSTCLSSIVQTWQNETPWVLRVDLANSQEPIKMLTCCPDIETVVDFLLFSISKSDNDFVKVLLKHILLNLISKPVFIIFDAFDEIKNITDEKKVLDLFKFLKNKTVCTLLITTRKHKSFLLEDCLSSFAVEFRELDETTQKGFLHKFWTRHLSFLSDNSRETVDNIMDTYQSIFDKAESFFGEKLQNFICIPLQMRMLAEVMLPSSGLYASKSLRNLRDLYTTFVTAKFGIYLNEKMNISSCLTNQAENWFEDLLFRKHKKYGFKLLFPIEAREYLDEESINNNESEMIELNRIGIIQSNNEEYKFIHKTFAEYFACKAIISWMDKVRGYRQIYPFLNTFLLKDVLLKIDYKLIRYFLNIHLTNSSKIVSDIGARHIVQTWLESPRDFLNSEHDTAIHVLVTENQKDILKYVLSVFKNETNAKDFTSFVAKRNKKGETALFKAAEKKNNGVIDMFLDVIEDNAKFEDIRWKILLASVYRNEESRKSPAVTHLKEYILNSKYQNMQKIIKDIDHRWGCILGFRKFAKNGKIEKIEQLLKEINNKNIEEYLFLTTDKLERTGLDLAAANGKYETVKFLWNKMSIEKYNIYDINGLTPLHKCIKEGKLDIVKYLVENGADVNAKDNSGVTIVYRAVKNGRSDILKYLVDLGYDYKSPDCNGITPFHCAAKFGYKNILEFLCQRKCIEATNYVDYLNHPDRYKMTAVSWASKEGHYNIVEYLDEQGANINCVDICERSTLHYASKFGRYEIVAYLLNRGVSPNTRDVYGISALDIAISSKLVDSGSTFSTEQMRIIELLLRNEATVDEKNLTKLKQIVKDNGYTGIAEILETMGINLENE